jgi:hypothetical protein
MSDIKTLNSIIKKSRDEDELSFGGYTMDFIREWAVKEIKKDLKWIGDSGAEKGLIIRWMERFDLNMWESTNGK